MDLKEETSLQNDVPSWASVYAVARAVLMSDDWHISTAVGIFMDFVKYNDSYIVGFGKGGSIAFARVSDGAFKSVTVNVPMTKAEKLKLLELFKGELDNESYAFFKGSL